VAHARSLIATGVVGQLPLVVGACRAQRREPERDHEHSRTRRPATPWPTTDGSADETISKVRHESDCKDVPARRVHLAPPSPRARATVILIIAPEIQRRRAMSRRLEPRR